MRRAALFALLALLALAGEHIITTSQSADYNHKTCLVQQEGRVQGNKRVEATILLRESTLEAHEEAIAKGVIKEPLQDSRLKALDLHALPAIVC